MICREHLLILLSFLCSLITALSPLATLRPPAYPLAVRSPYMNTWLPAGDANDTAGELAGTWPTFWSGQSTGWTGIIRVDTLNFLWMGAPTEAPRKVVQNSATYSATRSVFNLDVGGMVTMNVTFLSPVLPDDPKRQSMPFTYMYIDVQSADGAAHTVTLYTDVSAEWASGDRSQKVHWTFNRSEMNAQSLPSAAHESQRHGRDKSIPKSNIASRQDVNSKLVYHRFWRQSQKQFQEDNQQASWGSWFYVAEDQSGLSYQSGRDVDVRDQFLRYGYLRNSNDSEFRSIDRNLPVFAFALVLGIVGTEQRQATFGLALSQKNAIQFARRLNVTESLESTWTRYFKNEREAVTFFFNDKQRAFQTAVQLDGRIHDDSLAVGGENYPLLTALALRQAWAALQPAVAQTEDDPRQNTTWIFLKEISSDGDIQTVDVLYPLMPMLLYFNASLLKPLLEPLFVNQENGVEASTLRYPLHDLGTYPNATGYPNASMAEEQPLEEAGNMLIMALAYAQKTGDIAFLEDHFAILNQWAGFLVNDSLTPGNQMSSDDFAGPLANQTNLALKGIIGIQAMAVIADLTNRTEMARDYGRVAFDYITEWQQMAINNDTFPSHATLSYNDPTSWGLLYNLYADALLQTHLVPTSVYEMQSDYYPTVAYSDGVPLDDRSLLTKSDWSMWCAAVTNNSTRQLFIDDIATWIATTNTNVPVTDVYNAITGDFADGLDGFRARPVVGGWFSLLALKKLGIPDLQ